MDGCLHPCMAMLLMCTLHMSCTGRACLKLAVQLIRQFKLCNADIGKSMYSSLLMLAVAWSGVACTCSAPDTLGTLCMCVFMHLQHAAARLGLL